MSVAAEVLGFPGVAALIEGDQLSPAQVASLFAVAASELATKDGATVMLAAVTVRFNASDHRPPPSRLIDSLHHGLSRR